MPIIRLTDEQRDEAASKIEQARRMAKRFKPPIGMSLDEWESEVMLVLVEAVATKGRNANFEAHFYMRCRFRRMQLQRKRPNMASLEIDVVSPEMPTTLGEVLEGMEPIESDIIRLRVAGGDWETIGKAYGWCGRTVRRRYKVAVERLRKSELAISEFSKGE